MWALLLIGVITSNDVPPQMILTFDSYDECIEAEMKDHIYDDEQGNPVVYIVQESCQEF